MRKSYQIALVVAAVMFGGWELADWRQNRGLITLHAENTELNPVLGEVSRQSGLRVLVQTNVSARVTVHFERVTIKQALDVLAEQTGGRWRKLFLIGRDSPAIERIAREVTERGPPFLVTQMPGLAGGGMMAANNPSSANPPPPPAIAFQVSQRDLHSAALELALKAKTPIVVEESLNPKITLKAEGCDLSSVVVRMARAAGGKSKLVYHFHVSRRRGGMMAGDAGDGPSRADFGGIGRFPGGSQDWQRIYEEQVALLPPEEQQRIRDARAEWQQRIAEMSQMTPEERRKRFEEMANAHGAQERFDQRNLGRIKNLTPEQRVSRYQRYAARQRQRGGSVP